MAVLISTINDHEKRCSATLHRGDETNRDEPAGKDVQVQVGRRLWDFGPVR